MTRRRWIVGSALPATILGLTLGTAHAQQGTASNAAERLSERNVVPLKDQLRNGLRATTPGQFRFIDVVDLAVKQGRLPRAMVNLIYKWAIERNPSVPFPYFQYALHVLAGRRGIELQ